MDTNIYYDQYYMRDTRFIAVIESLDQLNLVWGLPEVVYEEVVQKHRERVGELNKSIKKLNKEIRQTLDDDFALREINVKKKCKDYRVAFKKLFKSETNMVFIPFPKVTHKKVIKRAVAKRKPFKKNGQGYRDTILWEAVLSELSSNEYEKIIFVTENRSDFLNRNRRLHQELVRDLKELKIPQANLEIFPSLYSFEKEYIQPKLSDLNDIKSELESDNYTISKEALCELLYDKPMPLLMSICQIAIHLNAQSTILIPFRLRI